MKRIILLTLALGLMASSVLAGDMHPKKLRALLSNPKVATKGSIPELVHFSSSGRWSAELETIRAGKTTRDTVKGTSYFSADGTWHINRPLSKNGELIPIKDQAASLTTWDPENKTYVRYDFRADLLVISQGVYDPVAKEFRFSTRGPDGEVVAKRTMQIASNGDATWSVELIDKGQAIGTSKGVLKMESRK